MAFGGYTFAETGRRSAHAAKAADTAMASGIARTIKQRTTGSIQIILIALVIRDNTQSREKAPSLPRTRRDRQDCKKSGPDQLTPDQGRSDAQYATGQRTFTFSTA
jgi:hypothetical protein